MTTTSPDRDGHGPRPRAPWLVLALVLACAAATALYVRQAERERDRLRFENAVQRTEDDLRTRLDTYVAVLRAGAGLWDAQGEVTRDRWHVFVRSLGVAERYPGVQGVGFSARVRAEERDAFVASARREGFADYDVRPEGAREEYAAILYSEPLSPRNRAALGFDMLSEATRREALERARDTGEPAATGRVTLVQETVAPKQAGFLIYVPVYRGGATPAYVEERRALLRGYVFSPFRADDLLRGIFGHEPTPLVNFRVYDGPAPDPARLMHATHPESPEAEDDERRPRFTAERRLDVAGRAWTLVFLPRPGSEIARGGWLPYSVLLAGLCFGGALFFVTRARSRARREAEAASADLRASESRFRTLVEQSPVSTQILAPDGRTLRVNRAWEELWGVKFEQLGDYNMLEDPQLEEKGIASYIRRGFRGEAVEIPAILYDPEQTIPGKTRHADPRRWVSAVIYPVKDEAGRVREVVLMHEDITERRRAEEELRAQSERALSAEGRAAFLASASAALDASLEFETTLETVAHLAVPALADFCFFDLITPDRKVQRVAWKHRDPALQKEFDEVWRFVPPQDFDAHPVARALRSNKTEFVPEVTDEWMRRAATSPEHLEFMRRHRAHSLVTVLLVARDVTVGALTFGLTDPARRFDEADVATAEDLARRAALAVSNARLYREAQEANRLKDEFLATLSHELRTPLTSVLGWARLLRTEQFDPEVTARALEAIERNAAAQANLINDLLDVSRIITGKLRLNVAPVELPAVVEAAVESLRPAAEARGVRLHVRLGDTPARVSADADRLRQVVWNLLSNAIKFTPRGGSVEVALAERAGHAEVVIADTGQGIAPEFLPHVFERFRQADGRITREHGGLGLGLAIARHLVELHGGTVRAASDGEGRGSTFTVRLPLMGIAERATSKEEGDAAADEQAPGPEPRASLLSGLHVLVVEDDADARVLLAAVLESGGARVTSAASAADGLAMLRRLRPDALIADIGMPGEDGYELLRKVRALDPSEGGATPAAALTAYARPEDRAHALAAGYQQHLPKPVHPATLTAAVAALCGRDQGVDG
jgi:PAS domain S-box-containing protein